MDRVFGAYFHAFNKNEDLYRQPSLNGNYTLYETDYGNASALHGSELQNVSYLVAPVCKVHCNALRPRSLERLLVMNV